MGDGEKAVAILNGNILATDQAFFTIAHDYIITADYKLLPATEAIGEDYESGYIAYPPDVMEKLLALDGY